MENIKICVVGLGYVGLPLARLFSTKYPTVGFDMNQKRVDALMAGHDATLEVADELLQDAINNHGFVCTTDIMIAMSTRLNELLLDENAHLGDMMQKALRYLNKFWKQLFTYSFNHTFIATCQMMGLSVLKYFKNLFAAIAAERTDYERAALPLVPVRVSRICCL